MSDEIILTDRQLVAPAMFDASKAELIKRTICQGASNDELELFFHQCQRTKLDPLARQIYAVFRNARENGQRAKKMSIQISIDGFRLIAERTGEYEGQTQPMWCGEDGQWKDVWLSKDFPSAARVGVFRRGFREACYGVALFDSYKQTAKNFQTGEEYLTGLWQKMPETMIAKCAESLALRKAFPHELSGLYSSEEMEQANARAEDEYAVQRQEEREAEAERNRLEGPAQPVRLEPMSPVRPVRGVVKSVVEKTTPKKGKKVFIVTIVPESGDDVTASTFSATIASRAGQFEEDGTLVIAGVKPARQAGYFDLESIESAESVAADTDYKAPSDADPDITWEVDPAPAAA